MKTLILIIALMFSSTIDAKKVVVDISETPYFFLPDENKKDNASRLNDILCAIKSKVGDDDNVVIKFKKARYNFYPDDAQQREYYVSNHDQNQPKVVGICIEEWDNLTLDGNGSEFVFHGQMLPLAVVNSNDITLKNFSIDFENPHIAQVEVLNNDDNDGITFRVEPWVNYRINENGVFETYGEGWKYQQYTGIAFEKETRHIVYQTSDLWIDTKGVEEKGERQLHAPNWKDKRLRPGTIVAMRTWQRPAPGIFLDHSNDTYIVDVTVHYAEGMGLLAQRCCDIRLNRFNVCLKENDARYFTTQADATHFSQCKGMIRSEHGLYEGMMDDAINVHGIYLKVKERLDDNSLICSYEHNQAWGFAWGDKGDSVSFVKSKTMEMLSHINIIKEIKPYDKETIKGTKAFLVTFEEKLPDEIEMDSSIGVENLSWTPQIIFSHNVVRNNRARGALFSSPLRTVCEDNIFDHTSGTAILLCGDCNGWYESGAVRDLLIKNNTFINALTNMFQFTNAVISIYPEIPDLENQKLYFHGGKENAIVIEKNHFITFDKPLLYAKSVDGLIFRKNKVTRNNDYKAFHWNQEELLFEKVNK
ncbi:MAG: alpha-1,3-galactosidase B [Bacteroidales bacterium]|nr:alpha-1,3-galactosidase B [Bacteroidales bacterium]